MASFSESEEAADRRYETDWPSMWGSERSEPEGVHTRNTLADAHRHRDKHPFHAVCRIIVSDEPTLFRVWPGSVGPGRASVRLDAG